MPRVLPILVLTLLPLVAGCVASFDTTARAELGGMLPGIPQDPHLHILRDGERVLENIKPMGSGSVRPTIRQTDVLELVTPQSPARAGGLMAWVSSEPRGRGGKYNEVDLSDIVDIGFVYRIEIQDDIEAELPNEHIVRLRVVDTGEEFYLRVGKEYQWAGIETPVIYRTTGDLAAFRLRQTAPSIMFGYQKNFGKFSFPYLSGNLFISTVNSVDSDNERTYSLSVGPLVDFAGWIQVGAIWDAKRNNAYLVFGIHSAIFHRLRGD